MNRRRPSGVEGPGSGLGCCSGVAGFEIAASPSAPPPPQQQSQLIWATPIDNFKFRGFAP
jgi:hypothetical protein